MQTAVFSVENWEYCRYSLTGYNWKLGRVCGNICVGCVYQSMNGNRKEAIRMTKVDIISGFLGAGKTTFIKQLINQAFAGEKLVLIENEFGEIGIDGGFLKNAGIEITEMNSGCICCTLVGDFSKALKKVLEEYQPDRVIIEPSGVGKLSDIMKAIEDVKKDADIAIDGRITVVDGKKAKLYLKNFGEFFKDQVEHASAIVISRTQAMSDDKIEECVHMLRDENKEAAIISTPWAQLGKEAIIHALEKGSELAGLLEETHGQECFHHEHHHHEHEACGHEHHHHHADEIFTSWGKETAHKYTKEELDFMLKALSETEAYGTVLRSKGIIQMSDGSWRQFDLVPQEYEVREGQPDYTGRLCVIGTDLKEEELMTLFHLK